MTRRLTTLAAAVVGRLAVVSLLAVAVSMLLFFAVEVLPGDSAVVILGQNATPERLAALREELHLNDPAIVRYVRWAGGVMRADLGQSIVTQRPVWAVLRLPLQNSLTLAAVAAVLIVVLAVGGGVVAGYWRDSAVDNVISTVSSWCAATPDFVLGTVLVAVGSSWLRWLPAVSLLSVGERPWQTPLILVLPALTLALIGGAFGARLIRAVVADHRDLPHVEAAEFAGVPSLRVLWRHVLPGVIAPIVHVLASLVPYLVGGAIVIERLFGYPGIGTAFVDQLMLRDVVVVEALGLIFVGTVGAALVTADLVQLVVGDRCRR